MKISADISLDDLVDCLYAETNDEELMEDILDLDDRVCDVDFTKRLIIRLVGGLRDNCNVIKLKIDGEKF